MRKLLLFVSVAAIAVFANPARAQFCPGVSPWVFDDVLASDPFCGFVTWMAENGVSRGTSTSLRPSFNTTSAARSMRFWANPLAMAARLPMVQGHTTMASGGLEPEAGGANHSSRPNTCNCPGAAPKRAASSVSTSAGRPGNCQPSYCLATTCATWEYSSHTRQPDASRQSTNRRP